MSRSIATSSLPLLADPTNYTPCRWDLTQDEADRAYWLDLFADHFPRALAEAVKVAEHAGESPGFQSTRELAYANAQTEFDAYLADCQSPKPGQALNVLLICEQRELVLRRAGIADPYLLVKQRENETAMALLPALLAELDAMPTLKRWEALIQGVFAGNIFDFGATAAEKIAADGVDFHATRAKLPDRPWLVDGLDPWLERIGNSTTQPTHRCGLLFVDNAGCDVVLGMLPVARELLRAGSDVILTANTAPALNDITHDELVGLVDRIAAWDPIIADALNDNRLVLIASGNGVPLIDLRTLSPQLVDEVTRRDVDLVILEGMGRGIESNYDATFTCDAIKIAMVKDQAVADSLGGKLFDVVMRYDRAM